MPHPKLIQFLSQIPELSNAQVEAIALAIPVKVFPKGTLLQTKGVVPDACFFVLSGLLREYRDKDGHEHTVAFYDEKYPSVSSVHYQNQTPFQGYLECMEESILISGNMNIDEKNYRQFPVLKSITSQMMETELNNQKEQFAEFVMAKPKERYLNLLERRASLFQRVPLHQIASYLGMTPESLSRIRKRVATEGV